ncbi:hypothetical protein BZA77DRAFT_322240 [Pyronema omphalodes]|nr:hypothetical protein BZA77DRAFT_322240 [Pyronema omphalodes]
MSSTKTALLDGLLMVLSLMTDLGGGTLGNIREGGVGLGSGGGGSGEVVMGAEARETRNKDTIFVMARKEAKIKVCFV